MTRSRIKDVMLYLLISLAVISIPLCALVFEWPWDRFMRWFGFSLFLAFLLANLVQNNRQHWKNKYFWLALAVLGVANLGVFAATSRTGARVPGAILALAFSLEYSLVMLGIRVARGRVS